MQSYTCAERIWQSPSVIKKRKKMGLDGCWSELRVWMTSYPEERSWEFNDFEQKSWGRPLKRAVEFFGSDQIRSEQFGSLPAEILNSSRFAARWGFGQHSKVSIGFYDLSLSPRVTKDWRWKRINSYAPTVFVLLLLLLISLWLYNNTASGKPT